MSSTEYAISLASVQAAAKRIDGLAHRTPVLTCHALETVATREEEPPKRLFFKVPAVDAGRPVQFAND
jgi:hypothetical protein